MRTPFIYVSIFFLALIGCNKDNSVKPQSPSKPITDTDYCYSVNWFNDSNTYNHTLSGNYSYMALVHYVDAYNAQLETITTWIRIDNTHPWVKLPVSNFFSAGDSLVTGTYHNGVEYREGIHPIVPPPIDVKASITQP